MSKIRQTLLSTPFLWNQSCKANSFLEICPVLQLLPHLPNEERKVTTYNAILLIIAQYSLGGLGALSETNNHISKSFLTKFYSRVKHLHPEEDTLVKPPEKEAPLSCTARSGASHWRGERQQALRKASLSPFCTKNKWGTHRSTEISTSLGNSGVHAPPENHFK